MAEAQDGFTPLHFCSQSGCAEGCRLLLKAGAKVDAKLLKTKKVRWLREVLAYALVGFLEAWCSLFFFLR